MQLQEEISRLTRQHFDRAPDQCDDHQLYQALLILARQRAQARPAPTGDRNLYYRSAEFLLGKLLSNQLLALGLYQPVKDYLAGMGLDLGVLESMEPEPSLGNGGLGRLLSGLHCRPGAARGRRGPELSLRPVPPGVLPVQADGGAGPLAPE